MENNPGAFELIQSRPITTLNLIVHEYRHRKTSAVHFHLEADNPENVFMVALRTVPMNSTGVAHVLEHTALCGSEKFPVRDPFFMMIRRSLNTFMNAFTTSDYTAYPFASTNRQDYFNLMDIYLDAVFFSRLDELDFAQEGHRLEFEVPDDSTTPLVYRGVVYNEMKGDSSSVVSTLYNELQKHLFPTTTYHYSSGGDPRSIPELTYENLVEFYQSHYHPDNAIFMTYGDMPVAELHEVIEPVLDRAAAQRQKFAPIQVFPEQRMSETKRVSAPYALSEEGQAGKSHIVMAWLLGINTDLEMLLKCNILADVLLDTSASKLRQALEQFEFAAAVSPLSGLEETNHEMSFMCGVEGSGPEHAESVEQLILSVLEDVAINGVPTAQLEAVLHQLELSQREIGGDGLPYGLQLVFSSISAAIHRGNPIDLLDLDPVLKKLREDIQDPGFIKQLVTELLLDNHHRVRLVLYPDANLGEVEAEAEKSRLQAIARELSASEKTALVARAQALKTRQEQTENLDVLPRVGLADVPLALHIPEADIGEGGRTHQFRTGTNGIFYHQVVHPLPNMARDLFEMIPLYSQLITEVGSANRDYLQTQLLQHGTTGGLSAFSSIRALPQDPERYDAFFTLGSRTVNPKATQMIKLIRETMVETRFDELDRIRDLVKQIRTRRASNIAGNGHNYALTAASARFRPVSRINHHVSGLQSIITLKRFDDGLDDPLKLAGFGRQLAELKTFFGAGTEKFLMVGDNLEGLEAEIEANWPSLADILPYELLDIDYSPVTVDQAFVTSTTVNYCAEVFPCVAESAEDSAPLTVLAVVLRNGFLHQAIREQGGAYGGGAGYDNSNGLFRFYSYRDPLLTETFLAFQQSVDWVLTTAIDFSLVEEAILGIVSAIDAPGSPAGDARQAFHNGLHHRDAAHRRLQRARILEVNQHDVKRVAEKYLRGQSSRAVVTSPERSHAIEDTFDIIEI